MQTFDKVSSRILADFSVRESGESGEGRQSGLYRGLSADRTLDGVCSRQSSMGGTWPVSQVSPISATLTHGTEDELWQS